MDTVTPRQHRNPEGLTLRQWFRAAGWELLLNPAIRCISSSNAARFEALVAEWSNGVDPNEWRSCSPKHIEDLGGKP